MKIKNEIYGLGSREPVSYAETNPIEIDGTTYNIPSGIDFEIFIGEEKLGFVQGISFSRTENSLYGSMVMLKGSKPESENSVYKSLLDGSILGKAVPLKVVFPSKEEDPDVIFEEEVVFFTQQFGISIDDIVVEYNYSFIRKEKND